MSEADFIFNSEPHPTLSKGSERREKYKIKLSEADFIFISEPHPALFKGSERREKHKIKLSEADFIFNSEPHPALYKGSERREKHKMTQNGNHALTMTRRDDDRKDETRETKHIGVFE